jgi:hypothetical protein
MSDSIAGVVIPDTPLVRAITARIRDIEDDGANAARDFLLEHGVGDADAGKVWLGIAPHTTPGVPEFLAPETALVTAGVETDVLERFDPTFARDNFVDTILGNSWPE